MNSKPKMALWVFSLFAILFAAGSVQAQQEITVVPVSVDKMLEPGQSTTADIVITNDGDAPLTWSAALSDTYGRGLGVSFTKSDFASWLLPDNQDRISDNVWITRGDTKSIFNAKSETTSDDNSPSDTEWALGLLNDATGYDTFRNMHGNNPQSLIGSTTTLHTITDDQYYELDFSAWTGGNNGGGVAYTRYLMSEYLSITSASGSTLAAGESATLTVTIDAEDLASAMYIGSVTIASDDADEGTIVIPINTEVLEAATFELSATSFSQTVNTGDEQATQVLTISNNGSSVLIWFADEPFNRPDEMSGVTLSSHGEDEVASGESQEVTITFEDDGNNAGTYEWPITFYSNDPNAEEVEVLISLEIVGEAQIDYDEPEAYSTTFVGSTTSGSMTIYNEGTSELVVSNIASSATQFVPTTATLNIEPGESEDVTILFSPDAVGDFNADITITSNAVESPSVVIAVEGDAIVAPEIGVTPLSITSSIVAGNSDDTKSITISNTGGSDLVWSFSATSNPRSRDESTSTAFTRADGVDNSLEVNQDRISDDVWITRGSSEPLFNYVERTSYTSNSTTIEWALGATEDLSPEDYSSSFQNAVNSNAISLPGQTMSLHLIEEDRYFDLEFSSWSSCCGGGFAYTRTEVVGWLETAVSSPQDPIAAGGDFTLDLNIEGEFLVAGDYEGKLIITSNDPLQEEIEVVVDVSVSGTPDITSTVATGGADTEVGNTISFAVPILNDGTDNLTVSNVSIDNGVFVPAETSFVVPAQSSYDLMVDFSPATEQSYAANLTITSDDPVSPSFVIGLAGDGLAAPTFGLSDMVLSATIASGTSTSTSFTVSNDGLGTLNWAIGGVAFEKGDYVDYELEENQDRIKEDVWITRRDGGSLFNEFEGGSSSSTQFYDSETYGSSIDDYVTRMTSIGGLSSIPGNTWSLYLANYDEYYDLVFDGWSNGNDSDSGSSGGGFSYVRRPAAIWLSIDNFGESLGVEGSSVVNVTLDASDLVAGSYELVHTINTNDPSNPTETITFQLEVTGEPNLSIEEGSNFDFENQFVDSEGEGLLIIRNTGTATLNVSDIQFDDAVFGAASTTASIAPNESVAIDLTFVPTAEQLYNATGTITSDDVESPATFSVSGTGVPAPDVSVDVSTIDVELLSGGAVEKTFTITNNGANSVEWSIEKILVTGTGEVLFEKADFADPTDAVNQDRVTDNLWITRGDRQGLFNAAIESEYTSGDRRRLLAIDADLVAIPIEGPDPYDASPKGTLWASNSTFNLTEESYRSWGSIIDEDASELPGSTLSMWVADEDRYFDIEFLSWTSGSGDGNGGGGGLSYIRTEAATWLKDFSSTSGTVDENDAEVTFNVDADGVGAGDYAGTIVISDGLNTHTIDVTLTVLGLPEISVAETEIDFGSVFTGNEPIKEIEISNTGFADLEISSITSDNDAFIVVDGAAPVSIGVDESVVFEVFFSPLDAINYSGAITINSNAVNSSLTLNLSGSGQHPPELSVDKTLLDQTLFFGASASQTFTISNTGSADLEWNLGVSGGMVEFSKDNYADFTLAENQDRITDDVWITRGDSRGIFNIAQEDEYDNNSRVSPIGTLWGYGPTGEVGEREVCCREIAPRALAIEGGGESGYSDWEDVVSGNPDDDDTFSMYLTESDLFFDVVFTSWTKGSGGGQTNGGGFSYTRTPAFYEYEAVSFSATEGVVAPGGSTVVTVFFNPDGTFDGKFELDLQVESNDPSGPAKIPLSLNVNGIIVETPIEDQLVNEGFGTSDFDISNMFADAQDDPLTYSIGSTDGAVASAVESGGILTVTEAGTGTTVISITAEDGKGSSDTHEFDFRVNAIPVVNSAIADQSYENAFASDVIDLNAVFGDTDAGDELTYSAMTSATGVVTTSIANGSLTLTEAGPGTVNVTVTADDRFGGEVSDVFEVFVNKINQTITFGALSSVAEDIGTVELTATASSNLTVTYASSNTSVATVSGSTLTIVSDGQTTITASQAGDDAYNAATPVGQSLTVDNVLGAGGLEVVEFYPNPVDDFLTITNEKAAKLEIYHLDGKLVLTQEITEKANLTTLDQGVYLVKLLDKLDNEIYTGRLVKN